MVREKSLLCRQNSVVLSGRSDRRDAILTGKVKSSAVLDIIYNVASEHIMSDQSTNLRLNQDLKYEQIIQLKNCTALYHKAPSAP